MTQDDNEHVTGKSKSSLQEDNPSTARERVSSKWRSGISVDEQIRSLSDFFRVVEETENSFQHEINNDNTIAEESKLTLRYFYRGQQDAHWGLTPSLFREIRGNQITNCFYDCSYLSEEQFLIQEAMRVFPESFASCKNDVSKMAVAQHHGIPTRLLDITGNMLVALYFAVQGSNKNDGKVFIFRANDEDYKLASTAGAINKISISHFHDSQSDINLKNPFLLFPPFVTARQRAQDGAFLLFSKQEISTLLCKEIIIPKERKTFLREALEYGCNIHEGTLFPESLSHSANRLKNEACRRILSNPDISSMLCAERSQRGA